MAFIQKFQSFKVEFDTSFKNFIYLFYFLAVLGLHCTFSICGEQGYSTCSARASHCVGFSFVGHWL